MISEQAQSSIAGENPSSAELSRLNTERYLVLLKNVFEFAHNAIKSVILTNGAAATALLAYLPKGENKSANVVVALALLSFSLGVAAGIVSSCMAYLSQYEALKRAQDNNFAVELIKYRKRSLAILVSLLGVLCFVSGIAFAATHIML